MLFFIGFGLIAFGLAHYYLWRKLVRATTRPGSRARRAGAWFTVGAVALALLALSDRDLPHGLTRYTSWPGYVWVAVMFYLLLGLAVLEVPALIARAIINRRARIATAAAPVPALAPAGGEATRAGAGSAGPASPNGPASGAGPASPTGAAASAGAAQAPLVESRRLFLARAVAVAAGAAAVGLVGPGVVTAVRPPRIRRVSIPLPRLRSGAARPPRIAMVSDIHLGPMRGAAQTRMIVELINDLDADVVAVVGDLVDGSVAELASAVAPLANLRSRYGTYFVSGNHEYFTGYQQWVTELPKHGLRLLRNERVELPGGFDLAGVNDVNGSRHEDGPDLATALAGRDESRAVVLLAHQPVVAREAARLGVDLQLSGHTHGGQMWPFHLAVRATGQPVISGLDEVDGMPIYVSNGAGFWGPPVRVGAAPEIALIELLPGS